MLPIARTKNKSLDVLLKARALKKWPYVIGRPIDGTDNAGINYPGIPQK